MEARTSADIRRAICRRSRCSAGEDFHRLSPEIAAELPMRDHLMQEGPEDIVQRAA